MLVMRRLWIVLLLAALAPAERRDAAAQPAEPRLLVVVVVDQLRLDDLETYRHRWRAGFRTLLAEGAHFTRAAYTYSNTWTCAGHTTIGTGTLPRTHGMVLNRWWLRDERRLATCTEDAAAPHISYMRAATGGNSAHRMLAPTLADELKQQRPAARVVSLSLKPRSSIGLAGHGGDVVTWFDEPSRSFVTSRAFAMEPVRAVREFIERQSPEADLGKTWALTDREASYRSGEIAAAERPKAGWTALFPHPLEGREGADTQFFDRWQKSPFSDAYLGRMATALVDTLKLGRGPATDYLAISFSALDLMGHDFGPDSREAEDLLMRLDVTLGELLQKLDVVVGRDNYVVALTADHGAAPVPEQVGGGRIASEDVRQALEQALVGRWGAPADGTYVAWVGPGDVYLSGGFYERARRDKTAMQTIVGVLDAIPGVRRVLTGDEVTATSPDPIVRAAAAGRVANRSGDLLIVPERNWVFELRSEYDATNHGTFHEYDRRVPVVLRGHGIRAGRYRDAASPADIAPTLAALAGVALPRAEGRVLREALVSR